LIEKYSALCNEVIIEEYFDEDNHLIDEFKKEADNIGLYYDDQNDKLINYNIFSKKNNLFTRDNRINENLKKRFIIST
jgi:hypothetical protein